MSLADEYVGKLDAGKLDSLSEKPVYVAFEYVDDESSVEYLFRFQFDEAAEGGAGPCDTVEEAVSKVRDCLRSFQRRNDVPQIGPGHVDLDDGTGEVEVQEVVSGANLGDFL